MAPYTMYYPSGRLFKDGVEIPVDGSNPDYQEYVTWLNQDNGPDLVPDPVEPDPTVRADQVANAMMQLGYQAVTQSQMMNEVFPLAVNL